MKRFGLRYADWCWREYAAALGCIARAQVGDGPHVARLAAYLARYYTPASAYPVNYGHTALRIALEVFRARRPGHSEVVVPGYICPSVVQTIVAAGLTPVAADIGPNLNMSPAALSACLGPATLAVVAPHMFGCPADIGEIERRCRDAGVFLVDDAAQVIGERAGGRLLGAFGDVGIVSFAQSKAVVTGVRGSGGVLLVNNPELDAEIKAAYQRLPAPAGRLQAFLHFLWNYLWSRYTGNSGYYLARVRAALGVREGDDGGDARISNLEAAIALVQLARLPQLRAARIRVAEAYHAALARVPGLAFPQYAPGRYLSRVMLAPPTQVNTGRLRTELARRGVESRLGYLVQVPDGCDTPQVAAARKLIGVPFHASLQNDAIMEICSILTLALEAQGYPPSLDTNNNETHQTAHQG